MKTTKILTLFLFVICCKMMMGQLGIGTSIPDPSAVIHAESTNKGVLFPRVSLSSSTDAVTIPNPAKSLVVYNTAPTINGTGLYINMGNTASPQWERYDYYDINSPNNKVNKLIYSGATNNISQVLQTQFIEWRLLKTTTTKYSVQARLLSPPSSNISITGNSILWNSTGQIVASINVSWGGTDWDTWKNLYTDLNNNWDSAAFLTVSNDPEHFYKLAVHAQIDVYNLLVLEIL